MSKNSMQTTGNAPPSAPVEPGADGSAATPSSEDKENLLVRIRNLRKVREAPDHRFELLVPDFVLRRREFVVLVGSNGCGKSTLLDMLGLIMRPDAAECFDLHLPGLFGKKRYERMKHGEGTLARLRARHFGYVLQSGGLLKFLSVRENARLSIRLSGCSGGSKRLAHLAKELEMEDYMGVKPSQLSGGQRQKAAIMRALVHQPPIVLADEPTAAVDQAMSGKVMASFKQAAMESDSDSAVVLVTHSPELVAGLATRCYTFDVSLVENGTVTRSELKEIPVSSLPGKPALAAAGQEDATRDDPEVFTDCESALHAVKRRIEAKNKLPENVRQAFFTDLSGLIRAEFDREPAGGLSAVRLRQIVIDLWKARYASAPNSAATPGVPGPPTDSR